MKKLISLLNSYPGVHLDEKNFVFSAPVYIAHQDLDMVNVKSKADSFAYIDKDFFYRRFDLSSFSYKNYALDITHEQTTRDLTYLLGKVAWFPYEEGGPANDQNKYATLEPQDIVDEPLPLIAPEGTVVSLKASAQSYYFRGALEVLLKKIPYQPGIAKIEIVSNLMIK